MRKHLRREVSSDTYQTQTAWNQTTLHISTRSFLFHATPHFPNAGENAQLRKSRHRHGTPATESFAVWHPNIRPSWRKGEALNEIKSSWISCVCALDYGSPWPHQHGEGFSRRQQGSTIFQAPLAGIFIRKSEGACILKWPEISITETEDSNCELAEDSFQARERFVPDV